MRKLPDIREGETVRTAPTNGYQRQDGWASPSTPANARTDIRQYWQVLRRRYLAVLLVTALTTAAAIFVAVRTPRVYSASCILLISPDANKKTDPFATAFAISGSNSELSTDVTLMKTHAVMSFASDILAKQGIHLDPDSLTGAIIPSIIPDTDLITITADSGNPRTAASIAEATGEAFADYQRSQARQVGADTERFLTEGLEDARRKLSAAEVKLQIYKEQTQALGVASGGGSSGGGQAGSGSAGTTDAVSSSGGDNNPGIAQDLRLARTLLADTQARQAVELDKVAGLKQKLDALNSRLASQHAGAVQDNNMVRALQQQLNDKQDQLAQARANYTAEGVNHYYPGLEDSVATLRKRLNEQVTMLSQGSVVDLDLQQAINSQLFQAQLEAASLTPQITEYQNRVAELEKDAAAQPGVETDMNRLLRDRDVLQHVYTMLLERQKQVEISQASVEGSATLVEHARPYFKPVRPDRKKDCILGVVLGLILGCSCAFLLDYFDNSIRSWEDIRDLVRLPALGAIPPSDPQPSVVWQEGVRSHLAEAYRMLRSNVSFISVDSPVKTIMLTSPNAGEGKSSTAANLACALAQGGKRVVIVDADMRKPTQFRLLGGGRHIGLAEVLSGANTMEEALRQTELPGVWAIPVDQLPPNPAELLSGHRVRDLIAGLSEMFDMVIMDTPPCLMVTDATVVASQVDAVILVVSVGRTTREAALRARDSLVSAHGRVVGVVLNRYQSQNGGGSSAYYYAEESENGRRSSRKAGFQDKN